MSTSPLVRLALSAGLALGIGATGLVLAPSAVAAPSLPKPTIADPTVEKGTPIVVSGTGCTKLPYVYVPNEVYYVGPHSAWFDGSTQADANGNWTLEIAMHVDVEPGTYQLMINCDYYWEEGEYPPVEVTVVAKGSVEPSKPSVPPGAIRGKDAITPGVSSPDTGGATGDRGAPGRKIVKVLKGFKPFEKVTVTMHSTPTRMGTFEADGTGTVRVEFAVAQGTAVGDHTLVYEGAAGSYFQESLTVVAASDGRTLAYTGTSVAVPLGLGVGALVLGGALVVVSRRRRATSTPS